MLILVMRHGPAGNSETWVAEGKKDAERPLSDQGRLKTQKLALGLTALVDSLDIIAASPYARCRQSAELLHRAFPKAKLIELGALRAGTKPEKTVAWLGTLRDEDSVAIVGHEPAMGMISSRLLSGRHGAFLRFRKGACALLETPAPVKPGRAILHWLLQPSHVRRMRPKAQ